MHQSSSLMKWGNSWGNSLEQSPWGVASGAIAGHVIATALAVLGGAFLAQYISEKVVSICLHLFTLLF